MRKLIIVLITTLCTIVTVYASTELPDIGSSSSRGFSLVKEQAVGNDYMRQLRAFAPIMNDAEINDYIQHLGFKLVEHNSAATARQFSFFIIRQNSINAFALPGGYIGVHTGLITKSSNESELASVLSHEIAHVTQRHLARRLELQSQLTIPSLAAFAAAILIATQSNNPDIGIGAAMGAQGLAQQALINHTRANEAEADRIGINTLYASGFDTRGAITFFEKMQQNSRYYSNAFEFLRTHPLSRSRITDARLRAKQYRPRNVSDPLRYHLIKEKVRALTSKVNSVTIDKAEMLYKNGELKSASQKYGYAIFMSRAKKFDVADRILKQLQLSDYKQPAYAIALAQLDIERKTPGHSIKTIRNLLNNSPGNLALVETLAELYNANTDFSDSRDLLLKNIHMTTYAPYLYKLLSIAQEGAGYKSEVYETEGNYLLTMGDLSGAKIKFEQAINIQTDDPYARARINAQLSNINEYIKQRRLRR